MPDLSLLGLEEYALKAKLREKEQPSFAFRATNKGRGLNEAEWFRYRKSGLSFKEFLRLKLQDEKDKNYESPYWFPGNEFQIQEEIERL